jgi:hypothetical protein
VEGPGTPFEGGKGQPFLRIVCVGKLGVSASRIVHSDMHRITRRTKHPEPYVEYPLPREIA